MAGRVDEGGDGTQRPAARPIDSSTWRRTGLVPADRYGRVAARVGRDISGDLLDELGFAREDGLVAEALPEFDDQPLAVEIALEVEQERLDPALGAAVVRVDADRDRGAVVAGAAPA